MTIVRCHLVLVAVTGSSLRHSPGDKNEGRRLHTCLKGIPSSQSRLIGLAVYMRLFQEIELNFFFNCVKRSSTHIAISVMDNIRLATSPASTHCYARYMGIIGPTGVLFGCSQGVNTVSVRALLIYRRRLGRVWNGC